jgi:mRNA-degrading endonuclease RelE of RelBE toxin-antitoxin system
VKRQPYEPVLSHQAEAHLEALGAGERAMVADAIERRLTYEPAVEARNRKPMDPDRRFYVAPWELRVAHLRVYYAVEDEPERKVLIMAIGEKHRDRIRIGGQYLEP